MTTTNGNLRCHCRHIKHAVTTEDREALKAQLIELAKAGDHLKAQEQLNRLGFCHSAAYPRQRTRRRAVKKVRKKIPRNLPTIRWRSLSKKARAQIVYALQELWENIAHDVIESKVGDEVSDDVFDSATIPRDEVIEVVLDNIDTLDDSVDEIVHEFFRIDRKNQGAEMMEAMATAFPYQHYGH